MLKAIEESTQLSVLGASAKRAESYYCPECKERVVPKQGAVVIHHFAHTKTKQCRFGRGESMRHMAMKVQVAEYMQRAAAIGADFEVPLIPGHYADVVLDGRVVVECQVSPINVYEWRRRTADYARAGYAVMWIWDAARIHVHRPTITILGDEIDVSSKYQRGPVVHRVPLEIRHQAYMNEGAIYVGFANGLIRKCALKNAYREDHDGTPRPLRTKRRLVFSDLPETFSQFEIFHRKPFMLARVVESIST